MKTIPLSRGLVTSVDDRDFERMNRFKWYAFKGRHTNYAARSVRNAITKKQTTILMHTVILKSGRVDHRDGDGLNNRRTNLRKASRSQNAANRGKQTNNKSGFKGVVKLGRRFLATIRFRRKNIYLGVCARAQIAAQIYNLAARRLFGAFAKLNPVTGWTK